MSDAYTDGFCHRCGRKRTECQSIIDTGVRCTDRRATHRGTGTFTKVLDITYTEIRKRPEVFEEKKK